MAVRRQFERDDLDALLADMQAVNGPVPAEPLEEVRRCSPTTQAREGRRHARSGRL
ncbi:MAG: hypothetical protein ACRD0K_13760 [Egibacteraceae bacterium]